MSQRILRILKDGDERRYPVDKDRLILGRDASCDIVLADDAISRRHAQIHFKHGSIYIENISTTGRVLRSGEAIEYVELDEREEVAIGPFSLSWSNDVATSSSRPANKVAAPNPTEESVNAIADPIDSPPPDFGAAAEVAPPEDPFAMNAGAEGQDAFAAPIESPPIEDPAREVAESSERGFDDALSPVDEAPPISRIAVDPEEKTVVGRQAVTPRLRVVKGPAEEIGRELRLTGGPQWIIGRSAQSHIQIDHVKFSRQHFMIQKIGDQFRVQDMGSANGTRLNGVAVTDAPLQPFDTIQVGPFEIQFVLVDADAQHLAAAAPPPPALPDLRLVEDAPSPDLGQMAANEPTRFVPPVPYDPQQGYRAPAGTSAGGEFTSSGIPLTSPGIAHGKTSVGPAPEHPSPVIRQIQRLGVWFREQPKERQRLYAIGSGLMVLLLILSIVGAQPEGGVDPNQLIEGPAPAAVAPPPPSSVAPPTDGTISPEFYALSQEKRNEIEDLYRKAETARAAQDWNSAYESAAAIARQVPRYKDTNSILEEAQAVMLEKKIGTISQSSARVDEAAKETAEKVQALMESGRKALAEGRFSDADETFHKVLNYDPSNAEAQSGIIAARNKQASIKPVEVPTAAVTEFQDADGAERQRERDSMDAFKARYQDIRRAMQEGRFREAGPMLSDLDEQLSQRVEEYDNQGRAPASIRPQFREEGAGLLNQVREARDTVKTQLRAEFQTQIADAEQHVANQQYALARETYDRILRAAPTFDEVVEARQRLYDKLVAEAKTKYHEALVYESVGDVDSALEGYVKTQELLRNVNDPTAVDYFKKSLTRQSRLKP